MEDRMGYRDREKEKQVATKQVLFSPEAVKPGTYRNKRYDFCLADDRSEENIYSAFRNDAIAYFRDRKIGWHDGKGQRALPSNHLCCSQSACVNVMYPFMNESSYLQRVFQRLGYDVAEVLPIIDDGPSSRGYIGFEWIGQKNYLKELERGKPARDDSRSRGKGFTSADFVVRFRQSDGAIRIVLGEWKYTENYPNGQFMRYSGSGTDRLEIYRHGLESPGSPIRNDQVAPDAFMYDPFDQLMRLQLLAGEMERHREMDANIVSVLHVAPRANKELDRRITSPDLRGFGYTVHEVWNALTTDDRFRGVYLEELISIIGEVSSDREWVGYVCKRYLSQ